MGDRLRPTKYPLIPAKAGTQAFFRAALVYSPHPIPAPPEEGEAALVAQGLLWPLIEREIHEILFAVP